MVWPAGGGEVGWWAWGGWKMSGMGRPADGSGRLWQACVVCWAVSRCVGRPVCVECVGCLAGGRVWDVECVGCMAGVW